MDRFLQMRIPLRAIGISETRGIKIVVGDAQWPKTAIFSVKAAQYR